MTDYLTVARGPGSVKGSLEHAMVLADVQSLPMTLGEKCYFQELLKVLRKQCV